jgi:uncharacterized protein YozE (UPF0346 family)
MKALLQEKICLLEKIFQLLEKENEFIIKNKVFDELSLYIQEENEYIENLKRIDELLSDYKYEESEKKIIFDLFSKIDQLKKTVIKNFEEKKNKFQEKEIFLFNKKELFKTYFQKTSLQPRFIDKLK